VNLLEGIRIALWSLLANPLRSFLTLLGMIIGVTAIIATVAVINGLNLYVQEKLITLGPGTFEVNRFGIITSRKKFLEAIRRNPELKLEDVGLIRERCPLLDLVGVKVYWGGDVRYRNRTVRSVGIKGASPEIMALENYEIESGRPITAEDDGRSAAVAFIGFDVAEDLFGTLDPIGREVKVLGRRFEVVGVGSKRGSVFGQSRDNYVVVPINTFRKMFGGRMSVQIVCRTERPEEIEAAMDEVRVALRARHKLRYEEDDDFGFVSAEALNSLWKSMSKTIFQIALFVVGISLVVGGIVIMNIMLVSVIERTREIGLRKAVGARPRDIRRQFLMEAVALSATGGLVGVLFSFLASQAISAFSPLPARFPLWAPFLAVGITSAIGIAFGLWPSAKASRLDPIEALRSE
jgi:putative ABC transport system permease protein